MGISAIIFIVVLIAGIAFFTKNVRQIRSNIHLGRDVTINDHKSERWKTMARVALGQTKMVKKPIAGTLHVIVYAGFIIINIEVLEIIIDGIFGTHRIFSFLGGFYSFLIGAFEILAIATWLACAIFLIRRNILKIKRFWKPEMKLWPRTDANLILIFEILLMSAFLTMNAADYVLQGRHYMHYIQAGAFPVSSMLAHYFQHISSSHLEIIERSAWWFHIVGILGFLNYLPYSKHFHIILAFPNTFYSNLKNKGAFSNMASVTNEVKMMLDPNADPYAAPAPADETKAPESFGAKDVKDLTWKQLMDAYSCTECGRCTAECPANQTGKLLSPRKIMMDTRDRLQEVGKNIKQKGKDFDDGKSLLRDYISEEEVLACTTCNACTQACPVNIDPLSIIIDLRRYLIMEESKSPAEWTTMLTNIENNGAPWQFAQADRLKWKEEVN